MRPIIQNILARAKTKEEAKQEAIEWQQWASERNLSIKELLEWNEYFEELGNEFGIREEFEENGII
jgi:hypothetical protein